MRMTLSSKAFERNGFQEKLRQKRQNTSEIKQRIRNLPKSKNLKALQKTWKKKYPNEINTPIGFTRVWFNKPFLGALTFREYRTIIAIEYESKFYPSIRYYSIS